MSVLCTDNEKVSYYLDFVRDIFQPPVFPRLFEIGTALFRVLTPKLELGAAPRLGFREPLNLSTLSRDG